MTPNEKRLIEMLEIIVNRATSPRPDSTGHEMQSVRKGLIDNARALLESVRP